MRKLLLLLSGNAAFPSAGTTNLHIDMSDAVNVMVCIGQRSSNQPVGGGLGKSFFYPLDNHSLVNRAS